MKANLLSLFAFLCTALLIQPSLHWHNKVQHLDWPYGTCNIADWINGLEVKSVLEILSFTGTTFGVMAILYPFVSTEVSFGVRWWSNRLNFEARYNIGQHGNAQIYSSSSPWIIIRMPQNKNSTSCPPVPILTRCRVLFTCRWTSINSLSDIAILQTSSTCSCSITLFLCSNICGWPGQNRN